MPAIVGKASIRKIITFERSIWQAVAGLAHDRQTSLQQLADEAFRDLLKKHNRPLTLREALKVSTRSIAANDTAAKSSTPKRRR